MKDYDRTHTARTALNIVDEDIEVIDWPARSSDRNPIEHVWDSLSRRISLRPNHVRNVRELVHALVAASDLNHINLVLDSLSRRISLRPNL